MKRKLLLAALCVVGALGFKANAEDEDYTSRIVNANMASKEGWTLTKEGTRDWSNVLGSEPSYVIEAYAGWSSFEITKYAIKQDVTLPSGKYRAEGYAFYRYGVNATTDPSKSYAYLVAGDFKTPVVTLGGETLDATLTAYPNNVDQASAAFTNGYYKSTIEFSVETEQAIEFGYEGTHVELKSWFICGPIKLYRTGDFDYSLYIEKVSNKAAEAKTFYNVIPAAAKAALSAVVDEKENGTYSTVAEYNAAANAIDAAIATYASDEIQASYAAWLKMKAYADAIVLVESDNDEALNTFKTALTTQNTAAEEATTASDIDAVTEELKAAFITYAKAANPKNKGDQFNITPMLTNPDLTSFWDGTWGIQPTGWATEQEGGNFQVMQNNGVNAADEEHKIFIEYYYLNQNSTWGNGKFNVNTSVTLPEGTYSMGCYAFAKEENYSSGNPKAAVFFYANDTQGSNVNSSVLTEQSIKFNNILEEDETEKVVNIGLKPLEGNTYNWMGIGYVQLYKEYPNTTFYDITVSDATSNDLDVTVAEKSLALETVTVTIATDSEDEYDVKVTSTSGASVDVANPSAGTYTFQMPEEEVSVYAFFTPSITLYNEGEEVEDEILLTSDENTITLTAEVTPAAAPQSVTWASSDASVATVSDGVITAVSSGEAVITVTSDVDASASATLIVKVTFPESEVPEHPYVNDGATRSVYTLAENAKNLFKNGSFGYPNAVGGWKTVDYTADAVVSNFTITATGGVNDGAYITTNGAGVGSEKTIRKAVPVEAGKTYYFSVYTSGKAPTANNFQYNALFQMTDATTEAGVLKEFEWPQGAENTSDEWSQTACVFTADEAHPYVGVRMGWNDGSRFDEFVLVEVTGDEPSIEGNVDYVLNILPTQNIGTDVFQYSEDAVNAAKELVQGEATVEDVEEAYEAVVTVNAPEEGKAYVIANKTAEGQYLNIATDATKLGAEAVVYFTAVEGGYALSNADGEYLFKTTNNTWTLTATDAIGSAYVVNFNIVGDGEYTISGARGLLGSDNAAAGSAVYANKAQTNNGVWTIAAYALTIGEEAADAYANQEGKYDVKLNRTISEGVNTIVLPFDMTQEEVEATFGVGSKVYVLDEYDSENANVTFAVQEGIVANVPCLLKATEASGEEPYKIANRELVAPTADATAEAGAISMIGSYTGTDVAKDENNYIVYNDKLYFVDSDQVSIKGTRAYFSVAGAAGIKALSITLEGEEGATAIAGIAVAGAENGAVYNISGQKVNAAYKGIVIKNGKKYLQK